MFVAAVVLNALVSFVLGSAAVNVAVREQRAEALLERVHATRLRPVLVAVSAAGAIGLLVGLRWAAVGLLAGAGVIAYMLGALGAHLRARDPNVAPPVVVLALAVVATGLRALTA